MIGPVGQLRFLKSDAAKAMAATTADTLQFPFWSHTFKENMDDNFAMPYVVEPAVPATAVPWPFKSAVDSVVTQFCRELALPPKSEWAVYMPVSATYIHVPVPAVLS
jgi:hypothetical protein